MNHSAVDSTGCDFCRLLTDALSTERPESGDEVTKRKPSGQEEAGETWSARDGTTSLTSVSSKRELRSKMLQGRRGDKPGAEDRTQASLKVKLK